MAGSCHRHQSEGTSCAKLKEEGKEPEGEENATDYSKVRWAASKRSQLGEGEVRKGIKIT